MSTLLVRSSNTLQGIHNQARDGPCKEWRKNIPLLLKKRHEQPVDSTSLEVSDQMKWTTSIDTVQNTKFILVGSGASKNNLFVIENRALNKLAASADYIPPDNSLIIRSAFTLPQPIYHLSVNGNHLATAGPNGCVQLYQLDSQILGQAGKGLSHQSEIVFGETSLSELRISPPGISLGTVRVNHVEFSKDEIPSKLIATKGRKLFVADVTSGAVLGSETLGLDTLYSASFSPHTSNLICTGGTDKTVSILDTRILGKSAKSTILSYSSAHQSAITDTKFNEFIPYWIASTAEDGAVKIWDIRYLSGPAARIDGHYGEVNAICWSTTHSDIISTGSTDKSWRAWSLNSEIITCREPWKNALINCPGSEWEKSRPLSIEDDQAVFGAKLLAEYQSHTAGPIVGMVSSKMNADSFYTVSSMGEVMCHTIRSDVFEEIAVHHFDDTAAQEVETAILSRNMREAYTRTIEISRNKRKEGLLAKHENELIDLCTYRKAIPDDSWQVAAFGKNNSSSSRLDMLHSFKSDLDKFSYFLPPRFEEFTKLAQDLPATLRLDFDLVVFRSKIIKLVQEKDWIAILKLEETLCECLELNNQVLDPSAMYAVILVILSNDFKKGLNIAFKLFRILNDNASDDISIYGDTLRFLLFPTMFEDHGWLTYSPIDDTHFCKKMELIKSDKGQKQFNKNERFDPPTNHKNQNSYIKRNEAIQIEASETPGHIIGSKVTSMIPMLRSIPSILAIELKIQKLIEEFKVSEWKDFDGDMIEMMQKWDLNTGGTSKKVASATTTSPGFVSLNLATPYEKTFSFFTNRLYIEALLRKYKYEDFFATCLDLCITFANYPSSEIFLKHVEVDGMRVFHSYVETQIKASASKLEKIKSDIISGAATKIEEPIVTNMKMIREPLCILVRVTALFMKVLELKIKSEIKPVIGSCLSILSSLAPTLTLNILKCFEILEKGQKSEGFLKEQAQITHAGLREAVRTLPLSNEKRPTNPAEKAMTGYSVHEEAFGLLDKLYRVYIKADAND